MVHPPNTIVDDNVLIILVTSRDFGKETKVGVFTSSVFPLPSAPSDPYPQVKMLLLSSKATEKGPTVLKIRILEESKAVETSAGPLDTSYVLKFPLPFFWLED
jgi:hypothetical protein